MALNRSRDLQNEVVVYSPVKIIDEYDREFCIEKYSKIPIEYSLQSPNTKEVDLPTTKNLKKPCAKMDPESLLLEFFCPTTISGEFNIEDFLPNESLFEEPVSTVPDIFQWSLDEPDYTEENLLEDIIIPSPEDSLLDPSSDLDKLFLENYIDLAAFESNPEDFIFTSNIQETIVENNNTDNIGSHVEVVDDSTSLVPEITNDYCAALLSSYPNESYVIIDDDYMINIPPTELHNADLLEPSTLSLLETFEKSLSDDKDENAIINSRKRGLSSEDDMLTKKPNIEYLTLVEETSPANGDTVTARRIKNNAASRVCRASRKARHCDLFEQETKLISENKALTSQMEELSTMVEFLRQHLVGKLSAKCS